MHRSKNDKSLPASWIIINKADQGAQKGSEGGDPMGIVLTLQHIREDLEEEICFNPLLQEWRSVHHVDVLGQWISKIGCRWAKQTKVQNSIFGLVQGLIVEGYKIALLPGGGKVLQDLSSHMKFKTLVPEFKKKMKTHSQEI